MRSANAIVAIMRTVQPLDQRRLGIFDVGDHVVGRQLGVAAAPSRAVQRRIAPHQDQPGGGIARRSVARPGFERAQAGFLISLFGRVHVAEITQQRRNRLGPRGGQCAINPGRVMDHLVHLNRP